MYLQDKLDEFNNRLLSCPSLSEFKVIKAYPFSMKPTKLNSVVIATSVGEVEADNISVGDENLYGAYKINAYIYTPYDKFDINSVIENVVLSQLKAYPSSIYVSDISNDNSIECLYVKCSMTFSGDLNFGGIENE